MKRRKRSNKKVIHKLLKDNINRSNILSFNNCLNAQNFIQSQRNNSVIQDVPKFNQRNNTNYRPFGIFNRDLYKNIFGSNSNNNNSIPENIIYREDGSITIGSEIMEVDPEEQSGINRLVELFHGKETLPHNWKQLISNNELNNIISNTEDIKTILPNYEKYFFGIYKKMYTRQISAESIKENMKKLFKPSQKDSDKSVLEVILEILELAVSHKLSKNAMTSILTQRYDSVKESNVPKTFETVLKYFQNIGLELLEYEACTCGKYLHVGDNKKKYSNCPMCGVNIDEQSLITVYDIPLVCYMRMMLNLDSDFYNSLIFGKRSLEKIFWGTEIRNIITEFENKKFILFGMGLDGITNEKASTSEFHEKFCNVLHFQNMKLQKRLKYSNLLLTSMGEFSKSMKGIDYIIIPRLLEFKYSIKNPYILEINNKKEEMFFILGPIFSDNEGLTKILKDSGWLGYYGCKWCFEKGIKDGKFSAISFRAEKDDDINNVCEEKDEKFYKLVGLLSEYSISDIPNTYNIKGLCIFEIINLFYREKWLRFIPPEFTHTFFVGNGCVTRKVIKAVSEQEDIKKELLEGNNTIKVINCKYFNPNKSISLKHRSSLKATRYKYIGKYLLKPIVYELIETTNGDLSLSEDSIEIVNCLEKVIRLIDSYENSVEELDTQCHSLFEKLCDYLGKYEINIKLHNVKEIGKFARFMSSPKFYDALSYESLLSDVVRLTHGGNDCSSYVMKICFFNCIKTSLRTLFDINFKRKSKKYREEVRILSSEKKYATLCGKPRFHPNDIFSLRNDIYDVLEKYLKLKKKDVNLFEVISFYSVAIVQNEKIRSLSNQKSTRKSLVFVKDIGVFSLELFVKIEVGSIKRCFAFGHFHKNMENHISGKKKYEVEFEENRVFVDIAKICTPLPIFLKVERNNTSFYIKIGIKKDEICREFKN